MQYAKISAPVHYLLGDLDSHCFLPQTEICYESDSPLAAVDGFPEQYASRPVAALATKKHLGEKLLSVFAKKGRKGTPETTRS